MRPTTTANETPPSHLPATKRASPWPVPQPESSELNESREARAERILAAFGMGDLERLLKNAKHFDCFEAIEMAQVELARRSKILYQDIVAGRRSKQLSAIELTKKSLEDCLGEAREAQPILSGLEQIEETARKQDKATQKLLVENRRLSMEKDVLQKRAANGITQEGLDLLLETIPRWKDRSRIDPGLASYDWFEKYWQPYFEVGLLYQGNLRKADRPLFNAIWSHCNRNGIPLAKGLSARQSRIA